MLLDLNDAESIVTWWAVYPERHGALLEDWARRRPEHRVAIAQARRLIGADPDRRAQLRHAKAVLRAASTEDAVPSHDELAAGEVEH